jgi:hypothetical protein
MMPAVTDPLILNTIAHSYYDYSMIHDYSGLSYEFLNMALGFEYKLSGRSSIFVQVNYYDLEDSQGYVYGNESGSFYSIHAGFRTGNFIF